MNNIKWEDLSIADLGIICINANEKIKINKGLQRETSVTWYGAIKEKPIISLAAFHEEDQWTKIRDTALAYLDQRVKSLL